MAKPVIIGIDAKWYFDGPPSGKMVIKNIVDELISRTNINKIYLFLDRKYKNKKSEFLCPNVVPVFIWSKNNLVSNIFVIPFYAKKYNIAIILYQNFISIFGNHKKIAYIHDILFKTHPQFYTLREKIYFSPLKYLSNKSDIIITVSETEKLRLLKNGYNKPVYVVYHGVNRMFRDRSLFENSFLNETKNKYNLPDAYLLYVGRLNIRKNITNLLQSIAIMKCDIPLVIVGQQDWKMFNLENKIQELNIAHKLIFTGSVYGEDLSAIYSLATAFIFPSFAESFGLPPVEAMASGIPIIVSNETCIPEICKEAGNYVDPNNAFDMAQKIDEVVNGGEVILNKRKLGLEIGGSYKWDKSVSQIIRICEALV